MWNEEGDRQDDIFIIEFLLLKAVACLGWRSDERNPSAIAFYYSAIVFLPLLWNKRK